MRSLYLLALALTMTCCTFVRPQDAALIDSKAANARAMAKTAAADSAVPAYLKTYTQSEANTWSFFSDWANGRSPTTQPSP
jgi:hypothetical protein